MSYGKKNYVQTFTVADLTPVEYEEINKNVKKLVKYKYQKCKIMKKKYDTTKVVVMCTVKRKNLLNNFYREFIRAANNKNITKGKLIQRAF
jgi:hypothetical protein